MIQQEFNTRIFRTQDQWDSGFTYRLEKLTGGGITLYSTPTFTQWEEKGVKNPGVLAIDECGLIYYIETGTCKLYRYNPEIKSKEHIPCISGCGGEPGKVETTKRILFDKYTMWVLDAGNERISGRIQAFSRENFQIRYIIDDLENPVDIGLDESGYIYVIEKDDLGSHIFTYDTNGQRIEKVFDESCLKDPLALAVCTDKSIYVIDMEMKKFVRLTDGKCSEPFGDLSKIRPANLVIDRNGNIFILDDTGSIYQFDPDGGCQGKINIPDSSDTITGIAVDSKGNLYASGNKGIAIFVTQKKYTREQGFYYSKTLDSGIEECQWHRLALDAEIPQKSILEIYFYSSDNINIKNEIDELIRNDKKTIQEKASILDEKFHWIGPEKYISSEEIILNDEKNKTAQKTKETNTGLNDKKLTWVGSKKNPRNILFRGKGGRYLWLKIVISTFDENVRPIIREMKVFYPRISYLRYLPAIYQEDPSSREFLDRFLSIFETMSNDLETEISELFKYFDPDTTPENFLSWLASWMNMALEEGWKEEKKREFIRRASFLYKFKGTPSGIEKLIEIYTGKKPLIVENWKTGKPLVLDGKSSFILGMNSLLLQTPVRGFRLGYDSILGRVALREVVQLPEDPFLPIAHSFTVVLDLSNEEFEEYGDGLSRILNDEKPAHTSFNLRIANEMSLGSGIYVGINTRVGGYKPIYLEQRINGKPVRDSTDNTIGYGVLTGGEEQGSRIERRSRLGYDIELI
ncbi:MAG: phage tail protein I [Candidatus Methanoperedens sp.]|nr:phage tail protein I [Candidatus Methanoperedens sp.]CAG0963572.1 Serine/threonine-protein kinase PknD [Methanosarcinales archaeon]